MARPRRGPRRAALPATSRARRFAGLRRRGAATPTGRTRRSAPIARFDGLRLEALDGSPRAEAIMPHVEELASCYGATVILVQIVEPTIAYTSPYDAYPELNMDQAERRTEAKRRPI